MHHNYVTIVPVIWYVPLFFLWLRTINTTTSITAASTTITVTDTIIDISMELRLKFRCITMEVSVPFSCFIVLFVFREIWIDSTSFPRDVLKLLFFWLWQPDDPKFSIEPQRDLVMFSDLMKELHISNTSMHRRDFQILIVMSSTLPPKQRKVFQNFCLIYTLFLTLSFQTSNSGQRIKVYY